MSWYVYIVRCGDNTLYTGITTDIAERLRKHNAGRGSRYVSRKGTARLVYTEPCSNRSIAYRRELEIKSWNRARKLALIAISPAANS